MTPTVHINRGVNRRYAAAVRGPGCRIYRVTGRWSRSKRVATLTLARTMLTGQWKRGVVLFVSDNYEPTPVFWMSR